MSDNPYQKNIQFYSSLLAEHGLHARSLNWGSEESQAKRFRVLSQVAELNNQYILDVGCGLGDYYQWLKAQKKDVHYHGIDITPGMIETATSRFPGVKFDVGTIDTINETGEVDYSFASGIFYLVENEPFSFMKATISKMFTVSRKAIAFNTLSDWATVKTNDEFYASPIETLEFCHSLSPYVTIRHDYHPADFTIYIYKDNPTL